MSHSVSISWPRKMEVCHVESIAPGLLYTLLQTSITVMTAWETLNEQYSRKHRSANWLIVDIRIQEASYDDVITAYVNCLGKVTAAIFSQQHIICIQHTCPYYLHGK